MAAPLDMSAIKKGDLLRVVAFDPLMINKVDIEQENPLSSRYLKPKSYEISGSKRNGIIHHSRCVELHGVDLPSIQRRLIGNDYIMWGDSRLRRMKPHIEDYIETDSAISRLITRLGVLFVKEPGVSHARTTKAFAKISNAVTSVARSITTKGIYYGDSRSEIGSVNSSVAGVSNILEIKQENISGMSRLPVTELFGKAKAGMSGDTNDGDIRNKQSFVETFRSKRIEDLSDIEEVLIRSALGRLPDDCKPEWCQLSVQTATEQADIELKEAQANKANKEASNPDKDKSE